jgi:hypothetical protein
MWTSLVLFIAEVHPPGGAGLILLFLTGYFTVSCITVDMKRETSE